FAPGAFERAAAYHPVSGRSELDRWIHGELNATAAQVVAAMDAYDNFAACQRITEFVDALSNWYVRRSRERFWAADKRAKDKLEAFWTLYESLVTTCKLIAPFTPFVAEMMWQNLAVAAFGSRAPESVHLCDYPTGDAALVDENLSRRMRVLRDIVSAGRSARASAKIKVRQPLARIEVTLSDRKDIRWLQEHEGLIRSELNAEEVAIGESLGEHISLSLVPNLPSLGPRFGKELPKIRAALANLSDHDKDLIRVQKFNRFDEIRVKVEDGQLSLSADDIQVRLSAKEGWAAAEGKHCVVALDTTLTPELERKGLAREIVRAVQDRRKEIACQYTDRIEVGIVTDDAELEADIVEHRDYICGETFAVRLVAEPLS
ncbi:MAG: DUF5915 domain-containing protein, partial [Pirellulales bacterium]